jgi:hypothetical protein
MNNNCSTPPTTPNAFKPETWSNNMKDLVSTLGTNEQRELTHIANLVGVGSLEELQIIIDEFNDEYSELDHELFAIYKKMRKQVKQLNISRSSDADADFDPKNPQDWSGEMRQLYNKFITDPLINTKNDFTSNYFNNYITGYGVKSIVELEITIDLFKEKYEIDTEDK